MKNVEEVKAVIERIEQDPSKSDVWKFRALMGGVSANAKYATAAIIDERPKTPGYLGDYELGIGLRPAQYANHAALIAEHALYWAAKIAEDQKERHNDAR